MSPLVALLALACAAPLAVQAQICVTVPRGILTPDVIELPSVEIKPHDQHARIDISDNCALELKQLGGVDVTVCDDIEPHVDVPLEYPFSPVYVERKGKATGKATIYVTQHCKRLMQ